VATRHGHVALLPWGSAALAAAQSASGLLALVVDAAWTETAADDQRAAWAQTIGPASAPDRSPAEPVYVVVDRDAQPAVALRVRWTLRLFKVDENLPHAALYAVRRDRRLLPLSAKSRSSAALHEARDQILLRFHTDRRAQARAMKLRQALASSARRGWRCRRLRAQQLDAVRTAVKAAVAAPGPLRPTALALLLMAARQGDDDAAAVVHRTLEAMARSGVRDQLDGGFFQAARDPDWRVPSFARTANLNAALLGVYASAAAQLGERQFADVARGIASYLLGTLRDPGTGAFFASQAVDASYYTWTSRELTAALPFDLVQAACLHWNIQPAARVVADPSKNVLYVAADADSIARFISQPAAAVAAQLAAGRTRLLADRAARQPPRLDRTHYVDVNAQVCSALLGGARLLDEPAWQTSALQTLAWLEEASPYRAAPYLGDDAALGRALFDAHVETGEPRYLTRAEAVATALLANFRDRASGALLDEPRDSLVSRAFWPEQPLEDLAGPSPAATAIGLLLDLARHTGGSRYQRAAAAALRSAAAAAADDPVAAAGYYLVSV
jgi:uncharacterized protein YyaL (SSP411 family)